MTDTILHELGGLLRPESTFVVALHAQGSTRAAIARALEAVDPATVVAVDGMGGSEHLEALLRARLQAGAIAGDVPSHLPVDDLAAFFAGVVLGLLTDALEKGSQHKLQTIRRLALSVWPDSSA